MIQSLKPNQIFIFGSNLAGQHIGGAAKQALEQFGAIMGQGEGMQGQSYAFPTLNDRFDRLSREDLLKSVKILKFCAENNPDKEFLLTRVGTGIAGYSEEYMNELLKDLPSNIIRIWKI